MNSSCERTTFVSPLSNIAIGVTRILITTEAGDIHAPGSLVDTPTPEVVRFGHLERSESTDARPAWRLRRPRLPESPAWWSALVGRAF
jgi:hypothetical protein